MNKHTLYIGLLALIFATQGFAKDSDYSRCVASYGYGNKLGNPIPFSLGPDGHLAIPDEDESYKRSENMETATEFLSVGNANRSVKLLKKDGKAMSLESTLPSGGYYTSGDSTTFSWDGNKCYVSQVILNVNAMGGEPAKKQVVYDKNFCDEVLDEVKGMEAKKLQECSNTFNRIKNIASKYQQNFESKGLELSSGFFGCIGSSSFKGNSAVNGFDFAVGCESYRKQYPTDGITKAEKLSGFAYGVGGATSNTDSSSTKDAK